MKRGQRKTDDGPGAWYSLNGCYMGTSSDGFAQGIYVFRQGNVYRKVFIKK